MGRDERVGRRAVLAAAAGGVAGMAGCGAVSGEDAVSVLAAGSLQNALENGLPDRVDAAVRVEAHGSARAARLVADGAKDPDIVSVADAALFDGPLRPGWHAEFATNAVVLAYDPDSEGGRRIAEAGTEAWYRPLLSGAASLGRTDPDLDPLGYRTLFALELATDHYGTDADLRGAVPERDQVYPETQLLSQFETGGIDAAFTYRSMAVDRGYEFVALPAAVDLSDPALADRYAAATYELPGGKTVRGAPIRYASTLRRESSAATDAFEAHVAGGYLADFGFGVPENYPRYTGDVPDAV
ncbi:extracellular solute-binding protein [Halostella litorea]|uniref:extracellular solute-binding protein n=1 Tax=Halostella litorea TaxID=2528831 RepID=UPI0010930583|nr:extracellular solute-binding protein [Halostella litorea]